MEGQRLATVLAECLFYTPLIALMAFTVALLKWSALRRCKWYAKVPAWCLGAVFCAVATLFLNFQVQPVEMRNDYLDRCQFNLKMISRGLAAYHQDYDGYPMTLDQLQPYLRDDQLFHCPRAANLRILSSEHLAGLIPEDYCPDCIMGNNFGLAPTPAAVEDYAYHRPPKDAPAQFVVVDEKQYNHALGWSRTSRYRNVLLLDGTIQTRKKPY